MIVLYYIDVNNPTQTESLSSTILYPNTLQSSPLKDPVTALVCELKFCIKLDLNEFRLP